MRILVLGGTAFVGRAKARAAGMPATSLAVTVANLLAWDRQRGEPPLTRGFSPEREAAVLAVHHSTPGA